MGKCVYDSSTPNNTCVFGDDIVSSAHDLNNLVSFPTEYVSCATAINTLLLNGLDPVFWCSSNLFTFKNRCCKTCASKLMDTVYLSIFS
jgi:hypothetical protein